MDYCMYRIVNVCLQFFICFLHSYAHRAPEFIWHVWIFSVLFWGITVEEEVTNLIREQTINSRVQCLILLATSLPITCRSW